ncbi:MAG: rhodanese-like domain-containing protein [Lentisphaeria bacterium]
MRQQIAPKLRICILLASFAGFLFQGHAHALTNTKTTTITSKTATTTPKQVLKLPDIIDSTQLKRMLMDQPGTFDIVDIRPAKYFKDFNLPDSLNVNITGLITDTTYQTGTTPLVIVDRNGTLAIAAGAILSQKTNRQIKVLFGGLEAYWSTIEMGTPIQAVPLPQNTAKPTSTVIPKTTIPTAPQPPKAPKKKSAGC